MADNAAEKLGEIYVLIKTKTDQLEKEVKDLRSKMDGQAESMGKSFSQKFTKFLALAGAATVVTNFFKKTISAAMEAEKAEASLRQQLGYTSQALLDQAKALQKLTVYEDDSIISAQARIAAFTKDEEQIKKLTEATLDLASAKGMDLNNAADLLAKSFGSSTNALARYGIEAESAAGSTNRLKQITEGVANLYGGMAQAQAKTFSGRLEQMKNRVKDIEEGIGKALLPTLEKLVEALGGVVEEGEKADGFFKGVAVAGRIVGSVFIVVKTVLMHIGTLLGTIGASMVAVFSGNFALVPGIVSEGFKKITTNAESLFSDIGKIWEGVTDKITYEEERKNNRLNQLNNDLASELSTTYKSYYDIIEKYYEDVKFLDENYFAWKSEQLIRQGREMQAAGLGEVETQQWVNIQLQRLMEEREKFFEDGFLPTISSDYGKEILDWVEQIEEAFLDGELKRVELQQRLREDMINTASQFGNELERAFGRAGDKFINYMNQALQAALRIMDILDKVDSGEKSTESGILGIVTSVIGLFGLHKGGSVTNVGGNLSYAPLPKAARGGSFVVPPGFPNDSALVRVESGETLHVTPAKQTHNYNADLSALIPLLNNQYREMKKLNKNLVNKRFEAMVFNPISPTGLVQDITAPAEQRLRREGVKIG